ncbi:MAG: chemotaxis protein CheB [Myxococcales bacterium]
MPTSRIPQFVVGIGASAGGLNALERFFDHLPKDTGMAFVVIQHLSPDFKSLMDELLARHTDLPIHPVEDGMPVEPDNVYLIPARKEMIISDGRLLLSDRERQQELTLPIDVFFRSLARDCGPRGVAIVLSGSGTDGSRGIRDVHEAGGLVIVQDIASAQFDGMPRTASEVGVAQWLLAPEDMPQVLLNHDSLRREQALSVGGETEEVKGIGAVYQMLQEQFGIDFTHYKPTTVTRRIERRLALARSSNVDEYVQRLRDDREELDVLYRDLLIGVTRFFRDQEAFTLLEERVLPELLQREPRQEPLRFWVAGCATGEEVYSLAIVLRELMEKLGERPVQIFATDVHRGSIDRASQGIYDADAVVNVSKERLARYFLRMGDAYQVVADLRQMVVFAQHNVIKNAPFTRVDFVSCRNLLIYLQPAVQQKVLSLFHFALKRGGVLFLGPSETAGIVARDFEVIDKHWRLYRKHTDTRMPVDARMAPITLVDPRTALHTLAPAPLLNPRAPGAPGAPGARYSLAQLLGTYDALLEDVMPPSLLVAEGGELVHAFGGASRFLRLRDGRQHLDVLDVVDSDLKMVLVGGLKRALNEPAPIVFKGVRIETSGAEGVYKVTIRRVRGRTGAPPHLLIAFDSVDGVKPVAREPGTEIDLDQISREQLRGLEAELSHTKENLQAAIEELETSNEELQASNEELQASNEELQSTNEELQSVNEELYTVNAEYQRKIGELTELANDMDNLLASTEIGTVFMDRQLRIRKFTPQIAETFSLLPHDVGRPIDTFAHKMDHPELVDDLKRVLASGEPVERELQGVRDRTFFLRILPYRAKGTIDGVVLTMIDVSGLKAAEDALFHERYLLNSLLATVPDAIYFKDAAGRFIRTNRAMADRLGLKNPDGADGKTAFELADQELALALHKQDEAVLRTGHAQHYSLEKRATTAGREEWDLVTRLPLRDTQGRIVGIIVIFRNVTEQKHAEEDIREAVRRRDQFLAMLSHELRNPLGAIVTATALLTVDNAASGAPGTAPSGAAAEQLPALAQRRRDRFLAILQRQAQQMTRLLDDLLEASRVTQNKVELKKHHIDLNTVVKDAVDAVRGQIDAQGISLAAELSPRSLTVDGDPARLQQIVVNLLSNAVKYTPRGGHVTIRAARENDQAVVHLRDDGAGIPADMLESIFDLFVQSRRTLDRSAGGLGVGLTLVRSLAQMHGGTVTAHSDGEGKGSEFVLRLPLVVTDGVVAGQRIGRAHHREQVAGEPGTCAVPDGATVVVVEDNRDSREMLCELLVLSGFKCHAADNGRAGLALIEEVHPDIAILDVGLPEMDGFELARRVRRTRKHGDLCLIALTGYGQPSDHSLGVEAGFDAHLVKPVQAEQLLTLLNKLRSSDRAAAAQ